MCSNHELQATLNALGYLEDGIYYKSRDCLNCSKDLVRYLRRDDPNEKTVRMELLKTDVISNDLIPLLKVLKPGKKDNELFDITLRLLVNLTQSALNCFELKIPEDKLKYNIFIEIESFLKKTKEPFTDEKFIQILSDKLKEVVSKEWEDRAEEEDLVVERILFLIRNILQIKPSDDDGSNRLETDINSHDILILSLHKAKLFETLIEMVEASSFIKYSTHILEILVLALQDQSPEELAKVSDREVNLNSKRSVVEKEKDSDELAKLLNKDKQAKKINNKLRMNSRHSRFMGTYVASNMKSINDDNALIVHKQARNMGDLLDDKSKVGLKKSKKKIALDQDDPHHRSVLFIRIILKNFCMSFMKNSYNTFLRNLRDLIARKKLEDEEVCYYYWLIQFLTEFNRNMDIDEQLKIEQIKETFSIELFHSVEIYIQRCIEMMRMDKKQSRLWSKRMHTSLKCYKENLITMFVLEKKIAAFNEEHNVQIQKSPPEATNLGGGSEIDLVEQAENLMESQNSPVLPKTPVEVVEPKSLLDDRAMRLLNRLKDQIFQIQEFRELFITLLRDFDSNKNSKGFLRDLIEANHIFLLLLEYHKKKNGVLSVMSKKKEKKKKSNTGQKKKSKETKEEKEKRLADQKLFKKRQEQQKTDFKTYCWQTQFSRIASLLQNEIELKCEEDNFMPFDFSMVTNDAEFDAQKENVIEKIQTLLSNKKLDDSIKLFREARALWPMDKDLFGESQISADEEFEVFKNLYMKELEIKKPEPKPDNKASDNEKPLEDNNDEGIEDDLFNNEELDEFNGVGNIDSDANQEVNYEEEDLDFEKFLYRYTHPHVLKCFIMMLGEYAKNSDFLNRCCMNMFERIAYECHATPCLYQLSLFNLVNIMYKDPLSRCTMDILDTTSQKKSIDDIYASTYSTEDMFAFFRQLISKFFQQAKTNDKLFLELLFFKEKKILFSLGEDGGGYEALGKEETKKRKVAWTQEEQDELKSFYEKFNQMQNDEDADKIEGDIIDNIMLHIQDGDRKRKDICNQLVNIGCVKSIDEFKESNSKKLGRNKLWRAEDLTDLKQCFQLVQENAQQSNRELKEMMPQLQECLKIKRHKGTIVEKLLELDLIKDRSEILGKKKSSKKNFLESNMNDFVASDKSEDDEPMAEKKKKKKKSKKSKDSNKSSNDLFDAESGSSGSDSSSASSSSDSESDKDSPKKSTIRNNSKLIDRDESDSDNEDQSLRLEISNKKSGSELSSDDDVDDKKHKKGYKSNTLHLSENDESADNEKVEKSKKKKSNKTKSSKEAKEKIKRSVGRKTARNVLSMILSDEEVDVSDANKDTDLIADLITEAKENSPAKSAGRKKQSLADDSESESVKDDLAKENLKSDDQDEEVNESESPAKKTKKRKKKFKIIDDSSNSSHSNSEPLIRPITVLSEIVNAENSQNIVKTNYANEASTRVIDQVSINALLDDTDSESDDDDMPLSMKISQPKRQRLILSDGDDE